jgi:hypothetical protein
MRLAATTHSNMFRKRCTTVEPIFDIFSLLHYLTMSHHIYYQNHPSNTSYYSLSRNTALQLFTRLLLQDRIYQPFPIPFIKSTTKLKYLAKCSSYRSTQYQSRPLIIYIHLTPCYMILTTQYNSPAYRTLQATRYITNLHIKAEL